MAIQYSKKINNTQGRIVVKVANEEIIIWRAVFAFHGRKADFLRKNTVSKPTLNNLLNNGMAIERVVKAVRQYCKNKPA